MGRGDVELMSSDDSFVKYGCEEEEVKSKDFPFVAAVTITFIKGETC